jgi:hypothetical protein
MSRPSTIAVAAVLLSLAAAPAHAQFGGLMKKAKNAAADAAGRAAGEKVVDKAIGAPAAPGAPGADGAVVASGEPLTDETITALIRGLRRTQVVLKEAESAQAQAAALNEKAQQIESAHPGQEERYREAHEQVAQCQSHRISDAGDARQAEVERKMKTVQSDPAAMQRLSAVTMKYNPKIAAAQQKGDVTEVEKLMSAMIQEMTGMDLFAAARADTAAAVRACGALPAKAAWLVELDAARSGASKAAEAQRSAESRAASEGAQESRLGPQRFNELRERMSSIVRMKDGANRLPPDQRNAFEKHQQELRTLVKEMDA